MPSSVRPPRFTPDAAIVTGETRPTADAVLKWDAVYGAYWGTASGGVSANATAALSGIWFTPSMVAGTGAQVNPLPLNVVEAMPIILRAGTLDRIGTNQSTGGNPGELFRLGIYADANGYPGALLVDAGTVSRDTLGFKTVTISLAITDGVYWIAQAQQGPSALGNCVISGSASDGNRPIAVNTMADQTNLFASAPAGYRDTGISGALPSTWTSTPQGIAGSFIPIVGVRYA